jgi:hypothetical protein
MKEYRVIVKEILYHEFYIDAETEEDAREEYERMGLDGELDFSYGEVTDQYIVSIKEV